MIVFSIVQFYSNLYQSHRLLLLFTVNFSFFYASSLKKHRSYDEYYLNKKMRKASAINLCIILFFLQSTSKLHWHQLLRNKSWELRIELVFTASKVVYSVHIPHSLMPRKISSVKNWKVKNFLSISGADFQQNL